MDEAEMIVRNVAAEKLYNDTVAAGTPGQPLPAKEFAMKRIVWCVTIMCLALALGFGAGMSAAGKSYQFTGTVKSSDGGVLTVEKSAKEIWTFSTDKNTKGTAKVGDKVTVYYNMVATEIEAKAATPAAAAKKPKK